VRKAKVNKSVKYTGGIAFALSLAVLISCTSTAVSVVEYQQHMQCLDGQKPGAIFVSGQNIGESTSLLSLDNNQQLAEKSELDAQHWFIKVDMGEKPTAGYHFSLTSQQLRIDDAIAQLDLAWLAPQPGGMTAQMITTPCIYLQLQKADYQQVVIMDSQGRQRFSLMTPY